MAVLPSPHIFARISGVTWVFLTTPRSEPVTVYVCVCWLRFLTSRSLVTTLTTCEVSPPPSGMITETLDRGPVTTVKMAFSDVWFIFFVFLPLLRILSPFGVTFAFCWTERSSSRNCQTSRLLAPTPALWRYFLCSGCIQIYSNYCPGSLVSALFMFLGICLETGGLRPGFVTFSTRQSILGSDCMTK